VWGSIESRQEAKSPITSQLEIATANRNLIWQNVYSRKTFLEKLEIFSRIRKEHSKANIKDIATKESCKPMRKANLEGYRPRLT